ncbi:MAG: TetR/AcrR family transcriptional regulator [Spirochaetes bacterium]|nr:TetR/AcrR family transcriptional regulator [Spirochaetota bacterium]
MQNRSEETRARISQTALRLFGEKGYEATGVAEICAGAQVSKGAFYHHFHSKQELFIGLLDTWLQEVDAGLSQAARNATSVPDGLLAMAAQTREVFAAADGRLEIFLEFWEQARHDPQIWKAFIAPYRRYAGYFAEIVRKGIAESSFRELDAQVAGQTLVALAVGIVVQGVLDPQGAPWDKVTRDAVALLMDGMRRR